jgi:thiol-disulfide isomerase/thioredoxin
MRKGLGLYVAVFWIISLCILSSSPLWAAPTLSLLESFGVQKFSPSKEPPPLSLKGLDGNTFTLSACKGKPVVLFFWGSWCDACKEDIVLLQQMAQAKKDQITFLTVAVDGEKEKKIRQIVEKIKLALPVLLVPDWKVIDTYQIRAIPQVVVVNQEGFMVAKIIGQRDWSKPEAWTVIKELTGLR